MTFKITIMSQGVLQACIKRCLLSAMFFLTSVMCLQAAELWLKDSVEVVHSMIEIGDIAILKQCSPEVQENLLHMKVATAPVAGQIKHITRQGLRSFLRFQNLDVSQIEISGQDRVRVSLKTQIVTGEQLQAACHNYLIMQLGGESPEHIITFRNAWKSLQIKEGDLELRCSLMGRSQNLRGQLRLAVKVLSDHQLQTVFYSTAYVQIFQDVWVATRFIERGQVINPECLECQRRDVTNLPNAVAANINTVVGALSTRQLALGDVLQHNFLRKNPVVKRGALVSMSIKAGAISIKAKGQSHQNGEMGEWISVTNIDSGKVIKAQVVGSNSVEVIL